MGRVPLLLALSFPLVAQQPGVIPEWEARRDIPSLPDKIRKLLPVLEQLQPQDWVAKGAPEAYVQQWKSAQDEVGYLQQTVDSLAKDPERLTLALEAYFRLQAIDTRLGNLVDAIRKYQNPALADLLQSMAAETSTVRVGLQQYITDVAAHREAEWRVMQSEAQRCRTELTAPPARKK
jgi:DNA repair ATPase RecN